MGDQINPAEKSGKKAVIFAVTSGKGGVGKSSLSVNMACEFSRRGHRTIIVDTDLGLANAHILAGIKPTRTLSDYIEGKAELAQIIETGPCKVKFISGGSGVKEMANLDDNGRARICVAIDELRPFCDVIILDTGAGVSSGVTDFVTIADHAVLVTTSNFAAIADAYGIVKVIVQDGFQKPIHCVVNRVRSPEEAEQVFLKLKGCTERFLGFDLNWLGLLPEDSSVEGAVLKRAPFSEVFPGSVASRYLAKLVSGLERYVGGPKPATQGAKI
ncbi:MAG: MinD/ParA family protein [Planctomycetes bacterium]|nr:MinD/ParA family protein [Planctomycetota bacterium]MBZ0154155.1 MinD/ParA family protein [Planctomycetota bacterium]MCC7399525.1 MinD/ParA family protein [Planctomycetota bacterium]